MCLTGIIVLMNVHKWQPESTGDSHVKFNIKHSHVFPYWKKKKKNEKFKYKCHGWPDCEGCNITFTCTSVEPTKTAQNGTVYKPTSGVTAKVTNMHSHTVCM